MEADQGRAAAVPPHPRVWKKQAGITLALDDAQALAETIAGWSFSDGS